MAERIGSEETVGISELTRAHSFEITALILLLERKGLISREEVIKEVERLRDEIG